MGGLPKHRYAAARIIPALVSKTAFIEFEGNFYSVPSWCASKQAEILAYPERLEIYSSGVKAATHPRSFAKKQRIQNPLHAESLLAKTSSFKYERICQLIRAMDPVFETFLRHQENAEEELVAAYELFILLKTYSKTILISAVRELNGLRTFKTKALKSLLNLPEARTPDLLWPQNQKPLGLDY